MSEFTEMLKKSKLESLVSYFLYGVGENGTILKDYDETIRSSYDMFFERLKLLYPEVNRGDDTLCDLVMDFVTIHEDVYFEAGMLIGFQLYKNMESGYQSHAENDLRAILQEKMEEKSKKETIS